MKRACLLLLALALVGPGVSLAKGRPGPPPPRPHPGAPESSPVQSIAAALCVAELSQLGKDAFKAKYPTREACLQADADQAAQIAESCKSAADPRACVRTAIGAPGERPNKKLRKDSARKLVPKVVVALCRAERKALGADGFKQKYGRGQACRQQMAPKAAAIVEAAAAGCASTQNRPACVQAAIAKALGLPVRAVKK